MSDDAAFIASVEALAPWVGRKRIVEDDIGLMAVRRVASMLDLEPDSFVNGTELPPHWFTLFFGEYARQSDIGADGHPKPGVVLPPIPLPRRMGAGRRVTINGSLRAGEPARKIAEVAAIVPKIAASVAEVKAMIRLFCSASSRKRLVSALPYQATEKPVKSLALRPALNESTTTNAIGA